MSHRFEAGTFTDKEIAEDILTSKKYISNYYYAPAILESMDPNLRSTFQQVNNDTQSQAKQVFDYLNSKGWYKPRQADAQSVNELRNTAQESRQILSSITEEISNPGGKTTVTSNQNINFPEQTHNLSSGGWQQQSHSQPLHQSGGWQQQSHSQPLHQSGSWQHQSYSQPLHQSGSWQSQSHSQQPHIQSRQWTGTQAGEGQSGLGPSSLAHGLQGSPSSHPGFYGSHGFGTSQSWQTGTGWQPTYSQTPHWTGTQDMEGQSGMGPSSLAQGVQWGGQPSWMQQGSPSSHYSGHSGHFGSSPQSFQTGTGWQPTYSQTPHWTGTQDMEGQSGMGPSSLAQGAHWGGQPSWIQSQPGTHQRPWG